MSVAFPDRFSVWAGSQNAIDLICRLVQDCSYRPSFNFGLVRGNFSHITIALSQLCLIKSC